jgi:hypothetical protein
MPVAIAAALPALWPAVAIMLIVWAAVIMFQKPLVALLSQVPVVGGAIADAVGGAIGTLIGWARGFASAVVLPLLELLIVPVAAFASILSQIVGTAEALIGEIVRVAGVAAGQAGRIATDLAAAVASIVNLGNVVKAVQDTLAAARALLAATIGTTIPRAIAAVQTWARGFVAAAISAADAALRLAISAAVTALSVVLWAPIHALQAAFALMPQWVQLRIAQAVAAVAGTLGIRLTGLEGLLGQLRGQVGTIEGSLAPILSLALPIAFPLLATNVATMAAQCIIPTCNALNPRLPLLNALSSGIMLYAVLDMTSTAIRDPEGAARETAQLAGTITGLVDDLVSGVTGIKIGA